MPIRTPTVTSELMALRARLAELECELGQLSDAHALLRVYMRQGAVPHAWLAQDGTIALINEIGARNLGGTPESLVGRTIYEVVPALAEQTRERVARAFAGEVHRYESRLEVDGTARWFSSFYHPIRDAEDRVIAAQIVSQETTDLRSAELALGRSEAKLEAAQRRAQLGTWARDLRDGTAVWSKQMYALVGLRPDGPAPSLEDLLERLHPEDRPLLLDARARLLAGESEQTVEVRTNPDNTTLRHLSCTLELRSEGGSQWIEGSMMDVTTPRRVAEERRQLQAQMEHAQKLESLGVLAGGIAHDFNNLLVSVMGNAELALLDVGDDADTRERLQEILAASQRAAELCGQMLAYSGRGQFVVRHVDLSAVVRDMAHLLEVSVSKRATIVSSLAEGLPAIRADVTQVAQIVMNLITNASEALEESGGEILVRTGVRNCTAAYLASCYVDDQLTAADYVFLEVVDQGCGMDAQERTRMFDPFFSSKARGRGLGLAAVLGIIRGHAGAIDVESAKGRGTRVTVLFPATDQPAEQLHESEDRQAPNAGTGTIMVVDDETPVRTLAERALERSGYLVFTASGGAEAVEFFREYNGNIDVVLLDVTMPGMGGIETLRRLREIDPEVRVILMSGYEEESAAPGSSTDAHSDFLRKPFRPTLLIQRVQAVLERPHQ